MEYNTSEFENQNHEKELLHSDKIIGIFSEPSTTFAKVAKFPPRTIDWLLPILILMMLVGVIRSLAMLNKDVLYEIKKNQSEMFDKLVKEGKMTQEQADKAYEQSLKSFEMMKGPAGWAINIISSVVFGLVFIFLIAGIYFLFIKFTLKGECNYKHVLVANGLTAYISMIQILISGILTFLLGKIVMDTSLANFVTIEQGSIVKFFLSKVDPISIWAYSVLSIGLAKLNNSTNNKPYFILVFALWILGGLLFFFISKAFPFLGGFSS
jgi:hypothetical protein